MCGGGASPIGGRGPSSGGYVGLGGSGGEPGIDPVGGAGTSGGRLAAGDAGATGEPSLGDPPAASGCSLVRARDADTLGVSLGLLGVLALLRRRARGKVRERALR